MSYRNIKRLDRKIQRISKQLETKYYDNAMDITPITGDINISELSPTALYFSFVPVGTGLSARVGRRIFATSLRLHMIVTADTSDEVTQDDFNYFRIFVVKWKDVIPDVEDVAGLIFAQPRNPAGVIANSTDINILAMYNLDFKDRYKILFDDIDIVHGSSANGDPLTTKFSKTYKLKIPLNHEIVFPEGSTNAETGGVVVYAFSDSDILPHPTIRAVGRLYFKDA